MKKDITELFLFVDDFCKGCDEYMAHHLLESGTAVKRPTRHPQMSMSEVMTIVLLYHQSWCKNFKSFYKFCLPLYESEFPNLLSYERFVELKPRCLPYLSILIQWLCAQSKHTNIAFVDATSLAVCHPKRISSNKVFKGVAQIGKTTKGWFFGLKLHLAINEIGQIHGVKITPGNVDDRTPVPDLTKRLMGLLFGDKGYIKKELFQSLYNRGLKLVTGLKKGMKNQLMSLFEKKMLKKRSIIETVFDYLKNKFELEHTRHRSVWNCLVHILSTLVVYSLKPTKPSITNDAISSI
jgi:hypothetical protein